MARISNPNCDGGRCKRADGEVRVYPIGGSGNLILCLDCWQHENRYNRDRGRETGAPENFPEHDWYTARVYGGAK